MITERCGCGASITLGENTLRAVLDDWRAHHRHEPALIPEAQEAAYFDQEITADTANWDAATARLAKTLAERRPIPLWDNSPAESAEPPCFCGDRSTGDTVHRADGPCYQMWPDPPAASTHDPQTSLSGNAAVRTSEPEPPTSVAPAGEEHGAPSDEPPAGTPVWWDGKWWVSDESGAAYTPTLWAERDTVKFWKFMPGALPALTPEQVEERVGKAMDVGVLHGREAAARDVATEFGAPTWPFQFSPGSKADHAVRAARGERDE